jgi:hypothetical protein
MRWGVEQRLEFIDFRLFWDGGINRSELIEQFGISIPQASKDLSMYEASAPGNLVYDKRAKRYFSSAHFRPRFFEPNADRYLTQLRSIADQTVQKEETWLSQIPEAESMPIPHRRVNVDVLRTVLGAIRKQKLVRVLYQSMNAAKPEAMWRWISPHALGSDGLRWHVRAFCHMDQRFKDFLLSRCLAADGEKEGGISANCDVSWNEFFNVVLVPNPLLSANQQAIIEQDYCMTSGQIAIPIRKSLLYYFRKRLRLDVAHAIDDVRETPVVVANRDAFEAALADADSSSDRSKLTEQAIRVGAPQDASIWSANAGK